MARVAWITPEYPPDRGGVSDHSGAMVSALRAQGHDVLVCSKPHVQGFAALDAELLAYRPDAVFVVYVPLGFAPRTGGLSPSFILWCTQLRRKLSASLLLLAHEVTVPTLAHWQRRELKLALLGVAQGVEFEIFARLFDSIVFSHEGSRRIWTPRLRGFRGRFDTIRICSSIPLVDSTDPFAELTASGYSVPKKMLLFFGTGHDSVLFDYVEAALIELLKIEPETRLVILGVDAAKLRRLRPTLSDLGPVVQALGFVPAREVSLWLQVATLVLAPLSEGVNARKTTVMAALQHGRAVATTSGVHTRDDIPWARICALAPLDRAAFAALAAECFQDPDWRARLGAAARLDYETHATASVTAARLLAQAESARLRR